ncbi:MAG: RNA polymerase sigma factor [Acidobacteriota bacterium]
MNDREHRLVVRAAAGDREAFDALIGPRWERIFRIALRIVGTREDAEDVAQRACLRLWQTLDRFRAGEDLDGWIYRMVTNLAIDALRRRRARREEPGPGPAARRTVAPAAERRVLAAELEQALAEVTDGLPERQKAVFVLARIEGFAPAEIARMLGLAPSTVRNHLFQARGHVARELARRFPGLLGRRGERP